MRLMWISHREVACAPAPTLAALAMVEGSSSIVIKSEMLPTPPTPPDVVSAGAVVAAPSSPVPVAYKKQKAGLPTSCAHRRSRHFAHVEKHEPSERIFRGAVVYDEAWLGPASILMTHVLGRVRSPTFCDVGTTGFVSGEVRQQC